MPPFYPENIAPFAWQDYMFPFDPKLRGCIPAAIEQVGGPLFSAVWAKLSRLGVNIVLRVLNIVSYMV
jgi:hypothetical protein